MAGMGFLQEAMEREGSPSAALFPWTPSRADSPSVHTHTDTQQRRRTAGGQIFPSFGAFFRHSSGLFFAFVSENVGGEGE